MRYNPIFVLGLPRSGTTLLQRVLNADPDVLIQGEQSGAFDLIAKSYRAYCKDLHARHSQGLSVGDVAAKLRTNSWIANLSTWDNEALKRMFHCMLLSIGNPTGWGARWGFKEVLFSDNVPEMIFDFYPKAKIILTTRNVTGFVQSMKCKGWITTTRQTVEHWNWRMKFIEDISHNHPGRTFAMRYEDIGRESLGLAMEWARVKWTEASDLALGTLVDATDDTRLTEAEADDVRKFSNPTLTYGT